MKIKEISLIHFRNYEKLVLFPHEGINIFFGKNGSGKTNLLEAVHYCSLGKSHRISSDQHVVMIGQEEAACAVQVQSKTGINRISVHLSPGENIRKTVTIDQKRIRKFSEMMGCLQCVIFSPEDLGLVRDGPSVRRRFLDMMISQLNRNYFVSLQQYRTAMEQRNAVLKAGKTLFQDHAGMLEGFERVMGATAAVIVRERRKYTALLSEMASGMYRRISGQDGEDYQLSYHTGFRNEENFEEEFLRALREHREDDARYGLTGVGPHRDDLNMTLNRKNLKLFASQGQMRSAALSIKLSQLKVLENVSGDTPVLLLDDVMSELDKGRRMRLLQEIGNTQTLITCSDESDLDECRENRTYYVSASEGRGSVEIMGEGTVVMKEEPAEPDFS